MKTKKNFLTLEILRENKACEDRYSHLVEKLGADWKDDQPLTLSKILEVNGVGDCLWAFKYFDKSFEDELKIIAIKTVAFAAKLILPLWTDVYPDDDRPAKAIEAAEDYLANPTKETVDAAKLAWKLAAAAVITGKNATAAAEFAGRLASYAAYAAAHDAYADVITHAVRFFVEISAADAAPEIESYLKGLLTERSL